MLALLVFLPILAFAAILAGAPARLTAIAAQARLLYNRGVSIDLEQVRMFLARKEERRRRELDDRFARARSDFEKIVRHITAAYNPLRIYQWGSLIERRHFSEVSDIWDRLDFLVRKLGQAHPMVRRDLGRFEEFLRSL